MIRLLNAKAGVGRHKPVTESGDVSGLVDPSKWRSKAPFCCLSTVQSTHTSCTYRLHFAVTWNCMQFTQSHFEGTGLGSRSCRFLASLSYVVWRLVFLFIYSFLKLWCKTQVLFNPTYPAHSVPFPSHPRSHFPSLKVDAKLRRCCFLTIRSCFNWIYRWLESKSNLLFVALQQTATSVFYSWNSARPVRQKFHERGHTRFHVHIK